MYSMHSTLYPLYAMFLAVTHWSQSKFIVGGQKPPPPSKTRLVLIAADDTLFIAFYNMPHVQFKYLTLTTAHAYERAHYLRTSLFDAHPALQLLDELVVAEDEGGAAGGGRDDGRRPVAVRRQVGGHFRRALGDGAQLRVGGERRQQERVVLVRLTLHAHTTSHTH